MPIYEYHCQECDKNFEVLQKMGTTAENTTCPSCQSRQVTKLFSTFTSNSKEGDSFTPPAPRGGGGG